MVSAGFLYAKGDPSGVADRPFLCGWLVVRLNEGFPGRRSESATRAHSRRRQAWNMRPAGEETRVAEVEPTWENVIRIAKAFFLRLNFQVNNSLIRWKSCFSFFLIRGIHNQIHIEKVLGQRLIIVFILGLYAL